MNNKNLTILFFLQLILVLIVSFFVMNKSKVNIFNSTQNRIVFTDTSYCKINLSEVNSNFIELTEYEYYIDSELSLKEINSNKELVYHAA